jgi:hypothetical protein
MSIVKAVVVRLHLWNIHHLAVRPRSMHGYTQLVLEWYVHCGIQTVDHKNITVGQNVVRPNTAAQYNCVHIHLSFTKLSLSLFA